MEDIMLDRESNLATLREEIPQKCHTGEEFNEFIIFLFLAKN